MCARWDIPSCSACRCRVNNSSCLYLPPPPNLHWPFSYRRVPHVGESVEAVIAGSRYALRYMEFTTKRRKTLSHAETVRCCQFRQSDPDMHGLAACQWTLFQIHGSLAPCTRCACGSWYCETHRTMGDHECPLLLETEGSSPASPTEPGDSELEDGQTPWGQEIPLHIPTPARRSSARRHEHDLSPFGGTDSTGDGPTLCMMCCHEGKSVGCQACGHVACSACTEATDIGGGHWQWLCPCCRDSTVQSPDKMHTMCPADDRCSRTESPCITSPPSRDNPKT